MSALDNKRSEYISLRASDKNTPMPFEVWLVERLSAVTAERDKLGDQLTTAILLCESRKTERDQANEELAFIKACGFEILTDALGRRYLSHQDRNHAYYASEYEEAPHD